MATSSALDGQVDPLLASENVANTRGSSIEVDIDNNSKHEADEHTAPTLSHGIAKENADIIGDEQPSWSDSPAVEVGDLGWNTESSQMARPIVEGVRNEQLWTILRRFNQQTFEVRQIDKTTLKNLDMNIGEDEEFSPDKLRAHLERLYVTVGLGCMSVWKHIARVRSWKEPNRTWIFFSVYYVAFLLDLLLPTMILCALVFIISPSARTLCFPPAPLALVDAASGGVQKPASGMLATADTMTGAPEALDGAGAEQEAHNVVNTIATMALATTAGQHPDGDVPDDNQTPDPTELANDVADARKEASGNGPSSTYDKTKDPVSRTMWKQAAPVMRAVASSVDTWERFANAMNPTPPFPKHAPRRKLVACLLPVFFASWFCTAYMLVKGMGLIVGVILFGQPLLTRVAAMLERTYPKWQRLVALQNSVLRGVPTNAQLAITLLRTGEHSGTPIPPPPEPTTSPSMETNEKAIQGVDLGATETEIQDAARPQKAGEKASQSLTKQHTKPTGKAHVAVAMLKGFAKSIVNTTLTFDQAKAAAGAPHAKERLGVVKVNIDRSTVGPVRFSARYKGKEGYAYITEMATTPALSWTPRNGNMKSGWAVLISDIKQLRKVGGLGWKSKVVVGWTLQRRIWDGLIITTGAGEEWHLTALVGRDDVFNRLIAKGDQMWELR